MDPVVTLALVVAAVVLFCCGLVLLIHWFGEFPVLTVFFLVLTALIVVHNRVVILSFLRDQYRRHAERRERNRPLREARQRARAERKRIRMPTTLRIRNTAVRLLNSVIQVVALAIPVVVAILFLGFPAIGIFMAKSSEWKGVWWLLWIAWMMLACFSGQGGGYFAIAVALVTIVLWWEIPAYDTAVAISLGAWVAACLSWAALRLKGGVKGGEQFERQTRNIPINVKREVWRRDQGRCCQCGSQYKLEYDHMIPFSKGGSNTARNIQLLCETCNRKKGAKIL